MHRFVLVLLGVCWPTTALVHAQHGLPRLSLDRVIDQSESLEPRLPRLGWIPHAPGTLFEVVDAVEPGGESYVTRVDARTAARSRWFDGDALRAALRDAGADLAPHGPVPEFRCVDGDTLRIEAPEAVWQWKVGTARGHTVLRRIAGATVEAIAPADVASAGVVGGELFVADSRGTLRRVTDDGATDGIVYGEAAHRAEFGITRGLWWDPTGRRLAFARADQRPIAAQPFIDAGALPTAVRIGRYPRAGARHSRVTIQVFDRTTATRTELEHGGPDRYWTNVTFTPDGSEIWVALVERNQSALELAAFDATTGERLRTILRESDPQWIEPEHGPVFLPDGSGFLWFSSRDGHRHLWRYALDGTELWQATSGAFDIQAFHGFSADGSVAYVVTTGPDPRGRHTYAVQLVRPEPRLLPSDPDPRLRDLAGFAEGWHECDIAEDGLVLDRWSGLYRPGIALVRDATGRSTVIASAADPLQGLANGGQQAFTVDTADGARLHGHVLLPPDPAGERRHPILLYACGGPHQQIVTDRWQGGASPWLQHMASLGYVVVRIDGRGTPNRGIDFEQAVHRHLGELEVLDQLEAIRWVAANIPFADPERVGVTGWSFGGYLTLRLMLLAPNRFVCGVAGAPVTDWRGYETGFTERYLDTPAENPDGYEAASVLPLVERLKGRLLLVHGTDDRTVTFSHAIAFLERAIAAGLPVDFMAYPGATHVLRGADRAHFLQLSTRYFVEHLPPPPPTGDASGTTGR